MNLACVVQSKRVQTFQPIILGNLGNYKGEVVY